MQVGVDFGTTNSIISYWDESARAPKEFLFGGQSEYTPSAVAYDETELMDIGAYRYRVVVGQPGFAPGAFF